MNTTISRLFFLVFSVLLSLIASANADGLETDVTHEVIACIVDNETVLGASPLARALVTNLSDKHLGVSFIISTTADKFSAQEADPQNEWPVDTPPTSLRFHFQPISPGESLLFYKAIAPHPGIPAGTYEYNVDVCVAPIAELYGFKIDPAEYRNDRCRAVMGLPSRIHGTFSLDTPKGSDKNHFDKYVDAHYYSRPENAKLLQKNLRREDVEAHKDDITIESVEDFRKIQSTDWYSTIRGNKYSAQRYGLAYPLSHNNVGDFVASFLDFRRYSISGRFRDEDDARGVAQARARVLEASYLIQNSDLAWNAYLYWQKPAYMGTRDEKKAITALETIRDNCPDCTLRAIAEKILNAYWTGETHETP
jgi:hypothetical protein